jgi:glycosyltransferase involved in cell wall biosynthesis
MKKTALVIFIYEKAIKYFDDLIHSINSQTNQNFEVIIFNDNVNEPNLAFETLLVPFRIIDIENETPSRIRFLALKILSDLNFDSYIFQDCDDCLSDNRVDVVLNGLEYHQLVVNDLDIMNEAAVVTEKNIWANRFNENPFFSYADIEIYNFVGLGNTSISMNLLKFVPIPPANDTIAIDWYLFYSVLKESKALGYFTSACTTLYRQHFDNTIGVADENKIQSILKVKAQQNRITGLEFNKMNYREYILPDIKKNEYPFWWELKINKL